MNTQDKVKTWRERIEKSGLRHKYIAEQINIRASALSRYIAGDQDMQISTFDKIEDFLKSRGL